MFFLFIVDGIILINVTESLLLLLDSDMMRTSLSSLDASRVEFLLVDLDVAVLEFEPKLIGIGLKRDELVDGDVSPVDGSVNRL